MTGRRGARRELAEGVGVLQAAPLQLRVRGRSQARAGPPPESVSAGPAQARAPVNLAWGAFPNARAGPEPLPALDIQGPHPLCAPKNKARRRPVPGPPGGQVSGGPGTAAPAPPVMLLRPAKHPGPLYPRQPRLEDLWVSPLWGVSSPPPPAPLLPEGETQRCRRGLPAPRPLPPQQWRAGPQRPGRPPPGREQVREGASAGSRRRPAPSRPLPAGGPRPAWRPRSPRFGPPPRFPSSFQNPPGKAPQPRRLHGKLHFGVSGAGRGLPRPRAVEGGLRGSGAGSNPRPPPPARPPVCLGDVPAHPAAAAAAPSLLPAPGCGSSRGRVSPGAFRQAHRDARGDAHGAPGRSSRGPRGGQGDTGARAGTRRNPDACRPERRTGAHAHKGTRTAHTQGRVCEGLGDKTPRGDGGGTCRGLGVLATRECP